MDKSNTSTLLWKDETNTAQAVYIRSENGTVFINLKTTTGNFSGHHTFFIPLSEIAKYIDTLQKMYRNLAGCLAIRDSESDSLIQLYNNKKQWFLQGTLGCSWKHNQLLFRFAVDQSVIQLLTEFLQSIAEEY